MRSIAQFVPLVALACAAPALAQELIPGGPAIGIDDRFVVARGLDSPPSFLGVLNDGTGEYLYAAGAFVTADGEQVNGLARWDGERWEGVGDGSVFTRNGVRATLLEAMAYFDDGDGQKLYVGGRFDRVGDVEAKGVACWDGESWSEVGEGFLLDGEPGRVDALVVFDDGETGPRLLAGGGFDGSNGTALDALAELRDGAWRPMPGSNTLSLDPADLERGVAIRDMRVFNDDGEPALAVAFGDQGAWIIENSTPVAGGKVLTWDGDAWTALRSPPADGPLGGSAFRGVVDAGTLTTNDEGELYVAGQIICEEYAPILDRTVRIVAVVAKWTGDRWAASVAGSDATIAERAIVRSGDERDEFFLTFQRGALENLHRSVPSATMPDLPFQGMAPTPLLADDTTPSSPLTRGRRARCEMVMFPSGAQTAPVVALGLFQQAPDRAATSVVRLDGEAWRTVGGEGAAGLGANAAVGELLIVDDGGRSSLLAWGLFSVIGDAAGSLAAAFDDGAWSPLGMRAPVGGMNAGDRLGFVAAPSATGDTLLQFLASRPTTGGDPAGATQFAGDEWAPLTFAGEAVRTGGGIPHATGASSYFLLRTGALSARVARWDGTALVDQFSPPTTGAGISGVRLSVHENDGQEALYAFDLDGVEVWDGASLHTVEATDQPVFHRLNVEPYELEGRPVTVVEGAVVTGDDPQGAAPAVLVFDGGAWSPAPILNDLAGAGERISLLRTVRLRGRLWLLIVIRDDANNLEPFLYDGASLTPVADILPAPDGFIGDILSNPLPDGREEVILGGSFLTVGGVPSSRIGRVILPAPWDFTGDGAIDGRDLRLLLAAMGTNEARFDLDGDGVVGRGDLRALIERMVETRRGG